MDKATGKTAHASTVSSSGHCTFRVDTNQLGNLAGKINSIEDQIKDANRQLTHVMNQADCRLLIDCMDVPQFFQGYSCVKCS